MKWLLTTFIIASLLTGFAARAGQYKEITTENEPRILVTGPDSFKNRLRYWFIMADGSPSIYWVVEKIGAGKYQETNVNNESGAIRLIFKGDTAARQHRYVGKVVSVETFKKTMIARWRTVTDGIAKPLDLSEYFGRHERI